ncbi:ATP-binding protein [Actinoplanes sp. NPDC051851]|uniref:ATP-binding protein n=1 Tax=Actinoplanes sp. NPDC051851 TaxID=3154753 RepID=UPI00341DDE6B
MGVSPPYLRDDAERGVTIRIDIAADPAVSLLSVRGPWDDQLRHHTSVSLRRCFTDRPAGLIVDLSGLRDPRSDSVPTWAAARHVAAALEPPVHLALCVPPGLPLAHRMQGLAPGRFLPVYARVSQARVALAGRMPENERMTATLPPGPEAAPAARNLVSDACLAWGLTRLLHHSRVVMSELVTNAVEHAGTEIRVAVTRRGDGLHLSVTDGSPRMPRLIRPSRPRPDRPLDDRGQGLRTVQGIAELWGAVPASEGKTVWATIRAPRTIAHT